MSLATIKKSHSWSSVPDRLFSLPLSPGAFKVIAWALGRPDGWVFYIGQMMQVLRLSDKTWPSARRELVAAGFFMQRRFRDDDGKIQWENIFTDAPLYSTIPPQWQGW